MFRSIAGTFAIAATLIAGTIVPAEAAGTSRISASDTVVGEDRTLSLTVSCTGSSACAGTVKLTASALPKAAKSYSLKKNSSAKLTFKLTAAQYKALAKKTSVKTNAVLTQTKPAKKKATKALVVRPAAAKITVAGTSIIIDDSRKTSVKLACATGAACKGTVRPVIGGLRGTAKSYSIGKGKAANVSVALSAAQYKKLGTKATVQRFEVVESSPKKVTRTKSIKVSKAATSLSVKTTRLGINEKGIGSLKVSCATGSACAGSLTPVVSGIKGSAVKYSVAKGKTASLGMPLNAEQVKALSSKASNQKLTVAETKPRLLSRSATLSMVLVKAETTVPPVAAVSVMRTMEYLNTAGKADLTLACASGAKCEGTLDLSVAGVAGGTPVTYTLAAGTTKDLSVALTAEQREKLDADLKAHEDAMEDDGTMDHGAMAHWGSEEHAYAGSATVIKIVESLPNKITHEAKATLRPTDYSVAYIERNWKPLAAYDTCTAAFHASFNATGPDSKIYPTWHPATAVDPATGEECSFGHEHGANPETSDIYDWAINYLAPEGDSRNLGIPFGYGSEELNTYADHHAGMSMRHEDNGGHKVFLQNDVTLLDEDKDPVTFTNAAGNETAVVCDYLIKQHQGSWSADATSNNAHELIYASKCNDGTEIITTMLSRFGNSNEFTQNCGSNAVIGTVGSTLPAGEGGMRSIPDADCLAAAAAGNTGLWAIYELWQGDNKVTRADGTVLAEFDPWFGIRNPSRYFDSKNSTATTNGISRPVDLAWEGTLASKFAAVVPWKSVSTLAKFDYRDPASPFDGAQRDFYLNQNRVSGDVATSTVYTDPYGGNAEPATFSGAIKQHLVPGKATATNVVLGTQKFDKSADYGFNNGVHAPN